MTVEELRTALSGIAGHLKVYGNWEGQNIECKGVEIEENRHIGEIVILDVNDY